MRPVMAPEGGSGGGGSGIRAYHGSPHDFEKFDIGRIGTGEGAQAYGHGLYFAENEGVARGYRDKLTDGASFIRRDGSFWDPGELRHLNVRVTARRDGLDAAIARAKEASASIWRRAVVHIVLMIQLSSATSIKPSSMLHRRKRKVSRRTWWIKEVGTTPFLMTASSRS